jgi:hypothetical protein
MVAAAGAGPKPIPHKSLNAQNLAEAISYCFTPQALTAAAEITSKMSTEAGVSAAVNSFHANLPLERLQYDLIPDQPAAWEWKKKQKSVKLSKAAVEILSEYCKIDRKKLEM